MAAFSTRTGIVVAPRGRLVVALTLAFGEDRISGYTVIANPARLGRLTILCARLSVRPLTSIAEPCPARDRCVAARRAEGRASGTCQ
jgi:hypothetical protein